MRGTGLRQQSQLGALALALLTLAGCSETGAPVAPVVSAPAFSTVGDVASVPVTPVAGEFWVCKVGTDATFNVSIQSSGATKTINVSDGQCVLAHKNGGGPQTIVAVEDLSSLASGFQLDSIVKDTVFSGVFGTVKITGTNTVDGLVSVLKGVVVTFYNSAPPPPPPPPPPGGQGCTPGYWKQSQHFSSWTGYTQTQLFGSVFNLPAGLENPENNLNVANVTLLKALQLRGGGVNALMRHTVAALLNAANSSVSYNLTQAQIIAAFNAAIAGGDIEGTKNIFAGFNEQGCPLN